MRLSDICGVKVLGRSIGAVGGVSEVDGDGDGFTTGPSGRDDVPVVVSTAFDVKLNREPGLQGFEDFVQLIANGKSSDGRRLTEEQYEALRDKPGYRKLFPIVDDFKKKFEKQVGVYSALPDGPEKDEAWRVIGEMRASFRRELISVVEAQFKKLLDDEDNNVFIQIDSNALIGVLRTGRFLTTFDDDAIGAIGGGGDAGVAKRRLYELEMFGIPDDSSRRPVYGYLWKGDLGAVTTKDEKSFQVLDRRMNLWSYGGISVRLKRGVRGRTTVTANDSLSGSSVVSPVRLNNPDISGVGLFANWVMDAEDVTDVNSGAVPYIETQIHGGVSLDDIEEIVVPQLMFDLASENPDDYAEIQDDIWDIPRSSVETAIELVDALKKSKVKVRSV